VWTGKKMLVWGGWDGTAYVQTGGQYDPATDSWTSISPGGAPPTRFGHSAVWTGAEMIVWGGFDGTNAVNTGAAYDPVADGWSQTLTPTLLGRYDHAAVWAGNRMIVWGGSPAFPVAFNDGARYVDQSLPAGTAFFTLSQPCRFVDTRDVNNLHGPALDPMEMRVLHDVSFCGVPLNATAVALNIAVTLGSAGGNLRLFPSDFSAPPTSAINFNAFQTRSNNAVIGLSADGLANLSVQNDAPGTVHLIIDVTGYFLAVRN
jgi:hypothetical protein